MNNIEEYVNKYKNDEESIICGNLLETPLMIGYLDAKKILLEYKRLNKQIKDARELLIKYMKMYPLIPSDDGAIVLLKLLGGDYTKDVLNTRGDV